MVHADPPGFVFERVLGPPRHLDAAAMSRDTVPAGAAVFTGLGQPREREQLPDIAGERARIGITGRGDPCTHDIKNRRRLPPLSVLPGVAVPPGGAAAGHAATFMMVLSTTPTSVKWDMSRAFNTQQGPPATEQPGGLTSWSDPPRGQASTLGGVLRASPASGVAPLTPLCLTGAPHWVGQQRGASYLWRVWPGNWKRWPSSQLGSSVANPHEHCRTPVVVSGWAARAVSSASTALSCAMAGTPTSEPGRASARLAVSSRLTRSSALALSPLTSW